MDELINWMAPRLARFELPDTADLPTDSALMFNEAFGLDFTGSRLTAALAAAVLQESRGLVSLYSNSRASDAQREGAYLTLTGQRRLVITSGTPPVEWID